MGGGRRQEVLVGKAIVISILQLIDGSDVYAKALTSYRNLDLLYLLYLDIVSTYGCNKATLPRSSAFASE